MNKHLKNTIWIYAATFLAMPLTYAIRVLYARNLSLEDFGIFYGLFGFFIFLNFLRNWGMNGAVIFFTNKYLVARQYDKIKTLFWFNQTFQFLLSVLVGAVIYIYRNFIYATFYPNDQSIFYIFPIFIIYWVLTTIFTTNTTFLTIFQNQKWNGILSIVNYLFILVMSVFFMLTGVGNYFIPPLAYLISSILIAIISLACISYIYKEYLIKPCWHLKRSLLKELMVYSNALVIAGIAGTVFIATDKIIIQYFKGAEYVAIYVVAVSTAALLAVFVNPFQKIIHPIVAKMWHSDSENKKNVGKFLSAIFNNYLIFVLPLTLSLFIFSEDFIRVVYGEKYLSASILVKILVFSFTITSFNAFVSLGSLGKPKITSISAAVAGIVNFSLNIFFVNFVGLIGIAFATLISGILRFFILFYYANKYILVKVDVLNILKIFISSVVFLIVCIFLSNTICLNYTTIAVLNFLINAIIAVFIAGLVYVIVLIVAKVITREKVRFFYSIVIDSKKKIIT